MFDAIERGLYWMSSFALSSDVDSQCQIDCDLNEDTFITTTGSLLTLYRLVGARRLIGRDEFEAQSRALGETISKTLMSGEGGRQHSVLFGFRSDKTSGRDRVMEILQPSITTAKRFGADADWLFADRLKALSPHIIDELAVFGIMTHRAGFSSTERERSLSDMAARRAEMKKNGVVLSGNVQMTRAMVPSLLASRHAASIATLEEAITSPDGRVQLMMNRLTCHQGAQVMRRFLDAGALSSAWRPQLVADKPSGILNPRSGEPATMIMPMRLSRQIVSEKLVEVLGDAEMCKKGGFHFASLALDILPQEDATPNFADLSLAIAGQIPWQVNFNIAPNGLKFRALDKFFATIFGAAGDHNKSVKSGWDALKQLQNEGESICAVQAIFTTWAKDPKVCVDNLAFLRAKVEAWGQTVVTNEMGSPMGALLAGSPGFSASSPAMLLPAPISTVVKLMPTFRPSSVWGSGQLLFHTKEGRPYPVALGSTLQNYWGTLVFAPTGFGKSFLMNMLNTGAFFSPGLTELPMITIIDKGPSAKGMLELVKSTLSPELASQCVYLRPTNSDASFTTNPCDTQLGCDKPMASDNDFIAALLGAMAPNLGAEAGKFLNLVIQCLYDYFGRRSPTAKKWQPSMDAAIHARLASVGVIYDESAPPRIWVIVDALFNAGRIEDAAQAQLFAVPTILDITTVINADARIKQYADAKVDGEPILSIFQRNIIAAQGQYRLFCGVSRFKGSERIMVIDTEGLATSSTSMEGRQVYGMAMLFARRLGARNFFIHEDDIVDVCPAIYKAYHKLRAQKIREQLKFLEYDEIHNARGITAVQELLQKDAREGRKYNIVTVLSSQELDDFPTSLVNNSYNFFILGAGSEEAATQIQQRFNLSRSEVNALTRDCTGPGKLFAMFKTENGMLSQVLYSRPSPIEKWAFSTSANDAALRDALYSKIGTRKALEFLGKEFPGGSARPLIEKMRLQMGEDSAQDGITAEILRGLLPKIAMLA